MAQRCKLPMNLFQAAHQSVPGLRPRSYPWITADTIRLLRNQGNLPRHNLLLRKIRTYPNSQSSVCSR
jgi:hypothetical protein